MEFAEGTTFEATVRREYDRGRSNHSTRSRIDVEPSSSSQKMMIRLKTETRACLLDCTRPGSLLHDVLAGAPVVNRSGDPPGGLYEIDCSDALCQELVAIAARHCPDAVVEIETWLGRQTRS